MFWENVNAFDLLLQKIPHHMPNLPLLQKPCRLTILWPYPTQGNSNTFFPPNGLSIWLPSALKFHWSVGKWKNLEKKQQHHQWTRLMINNIFVLEILVYILEKRENVKFLFPFGKHCSLFRELIFSACKQGLHKLWESVGVRRHSTEALPG